MQGDTPIKRKTFLEMSDEEQTAFIEALRDRRLHPINTYKEVREAAKAKIVAKLTTKIEKELSMFEKDLEKQKDIVKDINLKFPSAKPGFLKDELYLLKNKN